VTAGTRGAFGGALAAAFGMFTAWGFSVDDALITGRVAAHLARGLGYRFNADGPIVDAVTPLGWAYLLAPFAGQGAVAAVSAASLAGGLAWLVAAAELGRRCAETCAPDHAQHSAAAGAAATPGGKRLGSLLCWLGIALSLPLSAWAVAGMETGLVLALGTAALRPGWSGAACAGAAAALRPELAPWAVVLSFGQAWAGRVSLPRRALAVALALLPALTVALLRWLVFGRAAPLSVFAKPSDLAHGLSYAFGTLFLAGPPYLLLAGGAWRRVPARAWAIALAFGVHVVVLIGIGGDWMPFWRLAVPTFPGLFWVGAALAAQSGAASNALRVALVVASAALLHYFKGDATRAVRAEQAQRIAGAAALLAGSARVAGVDIGWIGAAASAAPGLPAGSPPSARAGPSRELHVVDLAGVTDPEVAFLPGGHTSKRLPPDFLERRSVDTLVLRRAASPAAAPAAGGSVADRVAATDLAGTAWVYAVDRRVLGLRGAEHFAVVGTLPLGADGQYVVLRRPRSPSQESTP